MKDELCTLLNIDNISVIDEGLQAFLDKQLSFDAFIFYLSYKVNINEQIIFDLKNLFKNNVNESEIAKKNPLISVIIPTFNRKAMLVQSIESVISQTYNNVEIIIIDDCSNDGTEEAVKTKFSNKVNIKYFKNNKKRDAGFNRNFGYNNAEGEYIIFLDDDDYYIDSNYFTKAINKHLQYEDLSFVCANTLIEYSSKNELVFSKLNVNKLINSEKYLENFQIKYRKAQSTFTAIFKKSVLDNLDFKNMIMMNDVAIYLRALLYGRVYIFEDFIGVYRIHDNNISKNIPIDFLLKTLDEKMWVYEKIKLKEFNGRDRWIYKQLMLTITYYILGSNPNNESINQLNRWVSMNVKEQKFKMNLHILLERLRSNYRRFTNKTKCN